MNRTNDNRIIKKLLQAFPEPSSELHFSNPYQLTVSVMLSAQCTDKKVNQVTPALFSRYSDFHDLSKARLVDLEKIIREVNYYKTKSRNLISMAQLVCSQFSGVLPTSRDQILSLPGVGTKTANVILGELGVEHTLPVDTHVFRVSQRLGWARGKNPEEIEQQLKQRFPSKLWRNLHHLLILHGRKTCKAQNPACSECSVAQWCPGRTK